jgi:uncharacterized glyoxalase superfamily protein PhnB
VIFLDRVESRALTHGALHVSQQVATDGLTRRSLQRRTTVSLTLLLRCSNLAQTREFYRTALGFDVTETAEGTVSTRLAGGTLIFTEQDLWETTPAVSATIYFSIPDADAYYASVKDKAAVAWPLQDMPYGSREFGLRDCNGYTLGFQTEVPKKLSNVREKLVVDDSDLAESHFSNTRLEKSVFANVNMHRSSFCDARLSEASFVDVNLANASIADSNLTGMRINGILVSELIQAYRDRG